MKRARMLGLLMAVAILLGTLSPAFAATAKAESLKYWIGVDIANQRTTIYSTEDNSVVHRWICSTGKKGYTTPVGVYYLPAAKGNERKEWFSFTKSYVKYAVCYKKGLYFHSILYKTKSDNSVMQSSVRQLGSVASHGCIRLEVQHAKWLCDNCPTGTKVVIHNGTSDPRIVEALGGEAGVEMTEPLPAPPIVQAVSLEQTGTVTLNRGETLQLNCTVKPDGIEANLNWKSSSAKYATVNGSGLVTGVAEGTTTITVSSSNGKKATVKVKVVDPYKPTGVTLDRTGTITVNKGETLQLNAALSPATAQSELKWSTSSKKYATVDANGAVTGVAEGTATITVKTYNGKKATVKVKVVDPYKPSGVKLDRTGTITVNKGETLQLNATLSPATAQSELKWSTSSKKYATVDANGAVTGVAEGTATITVKTYNGKKATVKVKVVDPYKPSGVKLDRTGTITVNKGETLQLNAALSPATAQSELKWSTSSKKYATVDANGTVTGVAEGTATITVKTYNGKKATVKVKVIDPYKPTGVTLDRTGTITVEKGETLQLNAALSPATAQSELKWSTSNKKRVTVDANGVVTGVAEGTATITVKTYNGKKATVKVKVIPATPKPTEAPAMNPEDTQPTEPEQPATEEKEPAEETQPAPEEAQPSEETKPVEAELIPDAPAEESAPSAEE